VIRICSKCGALLLEDNRSCSFCDAPAENEALAHQPVAVGAVLRGGARASARVVADDPAAEPEWRVEVTRRLEVYRARRRRLRPGDSQSGLPFRDTRAVEEIEDEIRERTPALRNDGLALKNEGRARPSSRQRHVERMEIHIQPELDFSSFPDDRAHPQTALVPVAAIAERRWAGLLDALFLSLTCAGFLGLFHSLGGQVLFEKMDAIVSLAVLFNFYVLYFFLFTAFAGATPGMQLRGLTIVRLDGSLPDTRQLLWRSFGYVLSGATLMLGFLWAFWDEDRFTWQDRISQTYVTAADPVSSGDLLGFHSPHHTFAHK
jgi:uncharacterized RDD family membrane protein YckC